MSDAILAKFRAICLALPEAAEKTTWDVQTFRVRDKIFATYGVESGAATANFKAPPGVQAILVGADTARFFVPAYVGHKGWVGVRLDEPVDWVEIETLMRRSYTLIAPKRLAASI
jgi:predicted DNA-binding protein (MmcQ/YjbR family)